MQGVGCTSNAPVAVEDGYNDDGIPNIVVRTAKRAFGSKSGRHSYWGVGFAEPIEGDCFGVGFYPVLANGTPKIDLSFREGRVGFGAGTKKSHWILRGLKVEDFSQIPLFIGQ